MLDYLIFFSLLLIGLVFYILDKFRSKGIKQEVVLTPFEEEFYKCESPIERALCRSLWMRNYPVICQYPFSRYRLDMALPNLKIAIEADGKDFHSSPKQKAHDKKRDAFLRSHGWVTLRFSGSQINKNMSRVITRIEKEIDKRKR